MGRAGTRAPRGGSAPACASANRRCRAAARTPRRAGLDPAPAGTCVAAASWSPWWRSLEGRGRWPVPLHDVELRRQGGRVVVRGPRAPRGRSHPAAGAPRRAWASRPAAPGTRAERSQTWSPASRRPGAAASPRRRAAPAAARAPVRSRARKRRARVRSGAAVPEQAGPAGRRTARPGRGRPRRHLRSGDPPRPPRPSSTAPARPAGCRPAPGHDQRRGGRDLQQPGEDALVAGVDHLQHAAADRAGDRDDRRARSRRPPASSTNPTATPPASACQLRCAALERGRPRPAPATARTRPSVNQSVCSSRKLQRPEQQPVVPVHRRRRRVSAGPPPPARRRSPPARPPPGPARQRPARRRTMRCGRARSQPAAAP